MVWQDVLMKLIMGLTEVLATLWAVRDGFFLIRWFAELAEFGG